MTMLPTRTSGSGEPALVLMHFLGGSAREWDEVRALLAPVCQCVALDMPGFGDASGVLGYTVEAMADAVAATLAALDLSRYLLVGHSMSGKVALVLARRAAAGLLAPGLEGLILIAPSPPGPEPMAAGKREAMLESLAEPHPDQEVRANRYITKNESRVMPPAIQSRAVEDVLRMNRAAWVAWLEGGSMEDWAERIGVLTLPVLLVSGEKDTSLGEAEQRALTLPHVPNAQLAVVADSGHLIPMEKPEELAALMAGFVRQNRVPADYMRFLASERVSPRTREVLLGRIAEPVGVPLALSAGEMATLQAVLARIVPQEPGQEIDLAGRIDRQLATGAGDGWRFDVLPADGEAYKLGLAALDERSMKLCGVGFAQAGAGQQEELIGGLDADPVLARWFADLRADAATTWVAHPATLARLAYSGIGVGGAETPHRGFTQIGIGEVEPWEPR